MIVIAVARVSTYITDLKDSGRIQCDIFIPWFRKSKSLFDNDSKKPF